MVGDGFQRMLTRLIAAGLTAALCVLAGEAGAEVPSNAERRRLHTFLEQQPMVFFVAKGPADSCGPGCSEWIAAVGKFESNTDQRFRDFLEKLNGRNLPIYFHSPGGTSASGHKIGLMLRERRMTAGVGRTETRRCRIFDKKDSACQNLLKTGQAVDARLMTKDAQCHSACVYAFVGASSRRVASDAFIGVHHAKFGPDLQKKLPELRAGASVKNRRAAIESIRNPKPSKAQAKQYEQAVRNYYLRMGIDPGLSELAEKTPSEKIYLLNRAELARFGVAIQGDRYETPWASFESANNKLVVTKSITRLSVLKPAENLTTQLYLQCSQFGSPLLSYRRELPVDQEHAPKFVGAAFDDWLLEFQSIRTQAGVETGGYSAKQLYLETIAKFAEAKSLTIWEQRKGDAQEIQQLKFSNAGLEPAVSEFRKRCVPEAVPFTSIPVQTFRIKPAGR
jgi:hypothetical protein